MRTSRHSHWPSRFARKRFPPRATPPKRRPRPPRRHVSTSSQISPPDRLANRSPLMHRRRIAYRQTGRPEANSAPVYEAEPLEVSRGGKSGIAGEREKGWRRFVHIAPIFGEKPFKLHDDESACHP